MKNQQRKKRTLIGTRHFYITICPMAAYAAGIRVMEAQFIVVKNELTKNIEEEQYLPSQESSVNMRADGGSYAINNNPRGINNIDMSLKQATHICLDTLSLKKDRNNSINRIR